jgi:hypothetical protein
MNYSAIMGDIVDSKKLKNRNQVTIKLKDVLEKINQKYKDELAAKFIVYEGDALQGLITDSSISYQLVKEIKEKLKPIELVFGIGIGELSTDISGNPITFELDGEAYHRAKDMINRAKKKKPTICYSFNNPASNLINSLIYFIESNESHRTKKQQKTIDLYENLKNQADVAKKLDINQATVSRNLNNALYYEIQNAENNIVNYLSSLNNS